MRSRRQVVLEHFNKYIGVTQSEKLLYKQATNNRNYFDYEPIFLIMDLKLALYKKRPEVEFLVRWTAKTLKRTCWCYTSMRVWL